MNQGFQGWQAVAEDVRRQASGAGDWLNDGQRASLRAIAERLPKNGVILADEVGMGKTRIAVCVARAVKDVGGRVAILVPPGLGFQWQEQLRDGGIDKAPDILRGLRGYFEAWNGDAPQQPWFEKPIVMLSHAFANWRSSKNQSWQWELLPMLYAEWRRETTGRLPRHYHASEGEENQRAWDPWVIDAAESICRHIDERKNPLSRDVMEQINADTPWPGALDRDGYSSNATLRPLLEKAIGLGLGFFDLVIIDEAHKSRGAESGLERLLENIVLASGNARRLAMTATPVELDVKQWEQILGRIDAPNTEVINKTIECYAEAVHRVRQCWSSNEDARKKYAEAAGAFQSALSPCLLRRDKRQDDAVRRFAERTGERYDAYRREKEIEIAPASLTPAWRQALCAAEALSLLHRDDEKAKRLRLTIGNGHGIATILDQVWRDEEADHLQEEHDAWANPDQARETRSGDEGSDKRDLRAEWWRTAMASAFPRKDEGLYDHPAILAAVGAIEGDTNRGEKVLVFGRFTKPMRDLVDLLNARAMLRALESGAPWPQSRLHEDELGIVKAAHRQLQCALPSEREEIDRRLEAQYRHLENRRERLREHLFDWIEQGLSSKQCDERTLLEAARNSVNEDARPLLARALDELMEGPEHFETQCAKAFVDLVAALRDRNEGDANGDNGLDADEARVLWPALEERLGEEYGVQRGTFARLMYGETRHATRRLLQLAFNRERGFPRVLVAQSMVGREGLNLHQACKVVVLLHPEWNPGVVEQQIGRVDRVGSRWARELDDAIAKSADIPRIEIRPVIFKGTYDEHNWKVLRERWDDLRAQLHGVIVPARERSTADSTSELVQWLDDAAPDFNPSASPPA